MADIQLELSGQEFPFARSVTGEKKLKISSKILLRKRALKAIKPQGPREQMIRQNVKLDLAQGWSKKALVPNADRWKFVHCRLRFTWKINYKVQGLWASFLFLLHLLFFACSEIFNHIKVPFLNLLELKINLETAVASKPINNTTTYKNNLCSIVAQRWCCCHAVSLK